MSYVSTAEVQAYLAPYNLPAQFLNPTNIQTYIDIAQAKIDSRCKRDFLFHQNQVEFYHGGGRDYLQLYFYPITSVTHVIMFNQLLQAMRVFLDTELIIYPERGQVFLPPLYPAFMADKPYAAIFGNVFIPGHYNIEVQYSYGYPTAPEGIKGATIFFTAAEIMKSYIFSISSGRSSVSFGGTGENYTGLVPQMVKDWEAQAYELLKPYEHVFYR